MKNRLLFFVFLSLLTTVFGQYESKYSQYSLNQLVLNPAIAGSEKHMVSVLAYRNQWTNSNTNLQQKSFTSHLPFNQKRMGIGLILFEESSKIQRFSQVSANFSYKINAFRGLLAFGMEGGFWQQKVDFSNLLIKDADDILLQNNQKMAGDFSAGLFYQNTRFSLGFSGKHLAFNDLNKSYFLHSMYVHSIHEHLQILPSILLKYHEKWKKGQADLNCHFKFYEQYWLGISYQTSREISLQMGLSLQKINPKMTYPFFIGYSFDYGFSALYPHNAGSHEIVLKIHLKSKPNPTHILTKKRYVSPLFF